MDYDIYFIEYYDKIILLNNNINIICEILNVSAINNKFIIFDLIKLSLYNNILKNNGYKCIYLNKSKL